MLLSTPFGPAEAGNARDGDLRAASRHRPLLPDRRFGGSHNDLTVAPPQGGARVYMGVAKASSWWAVAAIKRWSPLTPRRLGRRRRGS
jgi:hypothetical protein